MKGIALLGVTAMLATRTVRGGGGYTLWLTDP